MENLSSRISSLNFQGFSAKYHSSLCTAQVLTLLPFLLSLSLYPSLEKRQNGGQENTFGAESISERLGLGMAVHWFVKALRTKEARVKFSSILP